MRLHSQFRCLCSLNDDGIERSSSGFSLKCRVDSVLAGLAKGTCQRWGAVIPFPKSCLFENPDEPYSRYNVNKLMGSGMQVIPKAVIKAALWTLCSPLISLADCQSTDQCEVLKGDLTTALKCGVPLLQPFKLFSSSPDEATTSKGKSKKKPSAVQHGFAVINSGLHLNSRHTDLFTFFQLKCLFVCSYICGAHQESEASGGLNVCAAD